MAFGAYGGKRKLDMQLRRFMWWGDASSEGGSLQPTAGGGCMPPLVAEFEVGSPQRVVYVRTVWQYPTGPQL